MLAASFVVQTATDKDGFYQVSQLPIGLYEVAAGAPGFARLVVQAKNPLEINQTLRVDLTLEMGNTRDTITVESAASAVETENSNMGTTVDGNAVFELPLNGRNTLDLLGTQPGATAKNSDASRQAGSYSIGGMRSDSVTYLLDGGNNNHPINNDVLRGPGAFNVNLALSKHFVVKDFGQISSTADPRILQLALHLKF